MKIAKKVRNVKGGTLMSGLDIVHDEYNDELSYPGAFNAYGDVAAKVMATRLKQGKLPGYTTAPSAIQNEVDRYISNHPKAQQIKEEIKFNQERAKSNNPKLLGLVPAGAAAGAALPFGVAATLNGIKSPKGQRLKGMVDGAKAMLSADINPKAPAYSSVQGMPLAKSKYGVAALGAGMGLVGGAVAAKKLNDKYRDKTVGKKRRDVLNDISYDLDKHMREKEVIKQIADNSTYKAVKDYWKSEKKANSEHSDIEKEAKEKKKKNVGLRATGATLGGAYLGLNAGLLQKSLKEANNVQKAGGTVDINKIVDKVYSTNPKFLLGTSLAGGALLGAKSYIKNKTYNSTFKDEKRASDIVNETLEKEAGLKRDLRIAQAEAKAAKPRLLNGFMDSPEEIAKYQKDMKDYADSIQSFLRTEKNQDWDSKRQLSNLSLALGESSKNMDIQDSTKNFVHRRIAKKHAPKGLNAIDDDTFSYVKNKTFLGKNPNFNEDPLLTRTVKFSDPLQGRLADYKAAKREGFGYRNPGINNIIYDNDERFLKQLKSGAHKKKYLTVDQLKEDGVYFKTHSIDKPFNLAGSRDTYIKRDIVGNAKMPKKGIPIWASKLPEVSTTYGDSVLAFKPNKKMLEGASIMDHPHLATDTRGMSAKRIKMQSGWNPGFELNRNPEYERVFTYNKKNMDDSIVATYNKHKLSKGGRFDYDAYGFTKNKPGSLKDKLVRKTVNGPQHAYDLSAKEMKRLDRKALKRKAGRALGDRALTPFDDDVVSSVGEILTPTKIREMQKNNAFKRNVIGGIAGAGTAALLGYGAYKGIKKMKQKRDFLKQKEQEEKQEKSASEVRYELAIEKNALI